MSANNVRHSIPPRCNAQATCIAPGGYRACDAHRDSEGFATLHADDRAEQRCDYPMDGLGAARYVRPAAETERAS